MKKPTLKQRLKTEIERSNTDLRSYFRTLKFQADYALEKDLDNTVNISDVERTVSMISFLTSRITLLEDMLDER